MKNSNNQIQGNPFPNKLNPDEVDLRNILHIVKSHKKILLLFVIFGSVLGIIVALSLPRYFEVSMTVVPNEKQRSNNQQLSGIQALTGIKLGSTGQVSEKEIGLLILQSRQFILNFVDKYDLLPHLYPKGSPPLNQAKIYEDFSKLLVVNQEITSSDITISLMWKDAELAKEWLNCLMLDVSTLMRDRAKKRGEKSLVYLRDQLSQARDPDVRQSFIAMIKQETQKMMLTDIREEYLFEIIDGPLVPAYPSKPNRKLIVILSVFGGFIIGMFVCLFFEGRRRSKLESE